MTGIVVRPIIDEDVLELIMTRGRYIMSFLRIFMLIEDIMTEYRILGIIFSTISCVVDECADL